ncbi:hypothetical protein OH687_07355 [Burkholderia anthina]|nr:hypothetical protein OH687_07355 [Burkholderia anthina]
MCRPPRPMASSDPVHAPLSSIPERLRCGPSPANARPFGGQLARAADALRATAALQSAGSVWPAQCADAIPRRGRSFCLRVCGCAPSAAQPVSEHPVTRSPDACGRLYASGWALSI